MLRYASRGDLQRAAKAAADAARHQAEPVTAAVGQATAEAAQSVTAVKDVLQGIQLHESCDCRESGPAASDSSICTRVSVLQVEHKMVKLYSSKCNQGDSVQDLKQMSKQAAPYCETSVLTRSLHHLLQLQYRAGC